MFAKITIAPKFKKVNILCLTNTRYKNNSVN